MAFTWVFWLAVSAAMRWRGSRWWRHILLVPVGFTAAQYGLGRVDTDLAVIFVVGGQLVMAPRLVWEEVLRDPSARAADETSQR